MNIQGKKMRTTERGKKKEQQLGKDKENVKYKTREKTKEKVSLLLVTTTMTERLISLLLFCTNFQIIALLQLGAITTTSGRHKKIRR